MSSNKDLVRWADSQQYHREPIPEENRRKITVTLINPPRDPFGHLVALNGIYWGDVIRSLDDPRVTDEARQKAFDDLSKTALSGPLESIQFHFFIEGLTRSLTHQMVRSRFSFFAQESLRFAVPEGDWTEEIPLPPSLAGLKDDDPRRVVWNRTIKVIAEGYEDLVNNGIPAEEARDLLPHATPTRIHWVMDLRTLLLEAGKRTCTQAQFPWRVIFGEIAKALRESGQCRHPDCRYDKTTCKPDAWQYELMAEKIRPVCYQAGKCTFMAQFDRSCNIRERVEQNAKAGRPSSEWDKPYRENGPDGGPALLKIQPIHNHEWAADPSAARL